MAKDGESATGTTTMSEENGMNGKASLRKMEIVWRMRSRCTQDLREREGALSRNFQETS